MRFCSGFIDVSVFVRKKVVLLFKESRSTFLRKSFYFFLSSLISPRISSPIGQSLFGCPSSGISHRPNRGESRPAAPLCWRKTGDGALALPARCHLRQGPRWSPCAIETTVETGVRRAHHTPDAGPVAEPTLARAAQSLRCSALPSLGAGRVGPRQQPPRPRPVLAAVHCYCSSRTAHFCSLATRSLLELFLLRA